MNGNMTRKAYASLLAGLTCLALVFLTSCSSSSSKKTPPVVAVAATSGSGQSAALGAAFAAPLVATVTTGGTATSGVTVTFAAPSSGASCVLSATTATTDASGNASVTCTANSTAGAYTVTASATGASASASFNLTNSAPVVASTYVFYASGEELSGTNVLFYSIAGAVTIDANGNITGGEQDYNDALGVTATDPISAANGALVVDPNTGQGTLTIMTGDTLLAGGSGVEIFGVQFANTSHALIMQFDGSATSSGSLDLQTVTTPADGNYAFTAAGVDNNAANYASFVVGGVLNITGTTIPSGIFDINDADSGIVSVANPFTGTLTATDSFGRGTIAGTGIATTIAYYTVGPEVIRIIDVDANSTAVGSAFGQGGATFDDTSVGSSVFGLIGQWSTAYGTLGMFTTDAAGNLTGGVADDNELDTPLQQTVVPVAGSTYDLVSSGVNGYGSMFMTGTGDVFQLGLYMVDPTLNINDPNNLGATTAGGALIIDLDAGLPGGIGFITPQADPSNASFTGSSNTYVVGFQNFNQFQNPSCIDCEFDMIAPMSMSGGTLSTVTAYDSDPIGTLTGTPGESVTDMFSSAPLPDPVNIGLYSMSEFNTTPNQLNGTINLAVGFFDVDIYQASGSQLYWLNWGGSSGGPGTSLFLGSLEAQGSLTGLPLKRASAKTQQKQNTKPVKRFGIH